MGSQMRSLVIYGRPNCRYCGMATTLCDEKGISYEYRDIYSNAAWKQEMIEAGHKTVPQVYEGDRHIGGWSHLVKELQP